MKVCFIGLGAMAKNLLAAGRALTPATRRLTLDGLLHLALTA